jgi:hypothetical protein
MFIRSFYFREVFLSAGRRKIFAANSNGGKIEASAWSA